MEEDDANDVWDEKDEEDETKTERENGVDKDENEENEGDDDGRNPRSLEETGLAWVVRAVDVLLEDQVEDHGDKLNDPEEDRTDGEDETDEVNGRQVHRLGSCRARRSATRSGGGGGC